VVIKSNRTISPEKLDEFLKAIQAGCIRSKGYINLTSGVKVFLQGSFDRFTLKEVETFAAPTEFIVIGNFSGEQSHQKLFENLCAS
jgi:G3E family GTPase